VLDFALSAPSGKTAPDAELAERNHALARRIGRESAVLLKNEGNALPWPKTLKKIAVIGNGNYAAEEAIQLHSFSKDITILSHGRDFQINESLVTELDKNGIKLARTEKIVEISAGSLPAQGAQAAAQGAAKEAVFADGSRMDFEGFFIAIGTAGANSFAKKLGLEQNGSYLKINEHGETNLKGIYAAGDCTGSAPQVAVSVGAGCNAALSAIKFIRGLNIYIQYN